MSQEVIVKEEKALITIEGIKPQDVFKDGGTEPFIQKVLEETKDFKGDTTTDRGRKDITLMARRVGSSKALLDEAGKNLVAVLKEQTTAIDKERKRFRDACDAERDRILAPLEAYNTAEKTRIANIHSLINQIVVRGNTVFSPTLTLEHINDTRAIINSIYQNNHFEELATQAVSAMETAHENLNKLVASVVAYQDQQAEIAQLKADAEAKRIADRDAEIARTAAAQAAEDERRKSQAAVDAANKAKADAEAELERQNKAAQAAKDAEAAKVKAEEDAKKQREADQEHRLNVKSEAIVALSKLLSELTTDQCIAIVEAITNGQVPNISIKF